MREVLPGIHHWVGVHPRIGIEVSSYWLDDGGVLIDPLIPPEEGIEWFASRPTAPSAIVLSNRHHYRDSGDLVARFDVPVLAPRAGLHEFTHGEPVTPVDPGDELPGGITSIEIGGICPDETALHIRAAGALAIADGVIRAQQDGGELGFVPDSLMDEPPDTKRALIDAYARVLRELDFEHLLLAHGGPVIGTGRSELQAFVDSGGRTAVEL